MPISLNSRLPASRAFKIASHAAVLLGACQAPSYLTDSVEDGIAAGRGAQAKWSDLTAQSSAGTTNGSTSTAVAQGTPAGVGGTDSNTGSSAIGLGAGNTNIGSGGSGGSGTIALAGYTSVSPAQGGTAITSPSSSMGGQPGPGGAATAGWIGSTGGAVAASNVLLSGGTSGDAGGGSADTGGSTNTGSATSVGGSVSAGGSSIAASGGGAMSAAGTAARSNVSASGGTSNTGGVSPTGGSGGATAAGGATSSSRTANSGGAANTSGTTSASVYCSNYTDLGTLVADSSSLRSIPTAATCFRFAVDNSSDLFRGIEMSNCDSRTVTINGTAAGCTPGTNCNVFIDVARASDGAWYVKFTAGTDTLCQSQWWWW
jgi:hypothetical protein